MEYDAGKNLKEQMESAVDLYEEDCSLRSIADALTLNPIKVRKLLITAGVYESNHRQPLPQPETADRYHEPDPDGVEEPAGYRPCPYL